MYIYCNHQDFKNLNSNDTETLLNSLAEISERKT